MSRQEFIEGYVKASGFEALRTPLGFTIDGSPWVALPCRCGEDGCDGWAMVPANGVRWHLARNTDENITNPMTMHSDQEGVAMAEAYLAPLTP